MPRRVLLLASAFLLEVFPVGAWALCATSSFEEQIRMADLIFAGTVSRREYASEADGRMLLRYHFASVRYVKGTGSDQITLSQQANTEDEPSFTSGGRYIVFAGKGPRGGSKGSYTALACGWGPFPVRPDSGSDIPVVRWGDGGPIVAVDARHAVRVFPWPWDQANHPTLVRTFDASGKQTDASLQPVRPPSRPLTDEIRIADSTETARLDEVRSSRTERQAVLDQVHQIGLWPHQDPKTRLTEDGFVSWLHAVCDRIAQAADSTGVH